MESCERATSDFFSAMSSSKGNWYSLFDLDDTSFSLSQMFGVSIDDLLDVFEIIGFVKKAEKTKSLGLVCWLKHGWLVTCCYLQWLWGRKVLRLIGAPIVTHLRQSGKRREV